MLKLYKLTPKLKQYWETWEEEDGRHLVHWGEVGTTGDTSFIEPSIFASSERKLQKEILKLRTDGYKEVPIDEHAILLIEFAIEGWGTNDDLEKRHRLQDRMAETLGWSGLGHCDGGSSGSGTMDVCCLVVDFDIAKAVVSTDLEGTEFEDYSRIYDENETGLREV